VDVEVVSRLTVVVSFFFFSLVHLIVTIFFQMWIMRDMEKLIGAIRMAIIYIGSGIAGNLASCTFLPYQVEVGEVFCVSCLLPIIVYYKLFLSVVLLFFLAVCYLMH
jgi:membrane associated rhomboid family serine protease